MRIIFIIFVLLLRLPVVLGQDTPAEFQSRAVEAWHENKLAEAEQLLRLSLQGSPDDPATMGFLAMVLDAQNQFQEADSYYSEALALAPHSAPLLNNYGNHCAQTGDEQRAREMFLRVIQIDPKNHNANLQLARISVNRKEGRDALRYLALIPSADPAIVLLRAEALYWSGRPTEAMRLISTLEKEHAGDSQVLLATGMLLMRMERYDAAEQTLSRALAENPDDAATLFQLGVAAARAGHAERAQTILEAALRNHPDSAPILSTLGRVYATESDYPHAVQLLAAARKLAPTDTSNLLALAQAMDAAGYLTDAVSAYDDLVKLQPDNEDIRCDRALDYAATGKFDEAVVDLKQHIARFPYDPQGYFKLALITEQRDDLSAVNLLNKALALDSKLIGARYERGILLHRLGRLTEALPDLQATAAAEPENVEALSQIGSIQLSLGFPREAVAVLRKAVEIDPDNRAALMHLGKALAAVGKDAESQEVLAKLNAIGPGNNSAGQPTNVLELLNLPPSQRLSVSIAELQRAMERRPDDVSVRLRLGNALLEAGRREDAGNIFAGIHSVDPAAQFATAQGLGRSLGPDSALQELDLIPKVGRNGEFYLFRATLLNEGGRNKEACDTLQRNMQFVAPDAQLALNASLLEIDCGNYLVARALASKAHSIPTSLIIDAFALNQSNRRSQADAELRRAESCWPEWGKPYLVEGAIFVLRGEPLQASHQLSVAQSLGENTGQLASCLDRGGDCAVQARATIMGGSIGPNYPESLCESIKATK